MLEKFKDALRADTPWGIVSSALFGIILGCIIGGVLVSFGVHW